MFISATFEMISSLGSVALLSGLVPSFSGPECAAGLWSGQSLCLLPERQATKVLHHIFVLLAQDVSFRKDNRFFFLS